MVKHIKLLAGHFSSFLDIGSKDLVCHDKLFLERNGFCNTIQTFSNPRLWLLALCMYQHYYQQTKDSSRDGRSTINWSIRSWGGYEIYKYCLKCNMDALIWLKFSVHCKYSSRNIWGFYACVIIRCTIVVLITALGCAQLSDVMNLISCTLFVSIATNRC